MGQKRTDLLRGTLDLLVLKALSLEPLHGVGISRRITQITKGAYEVSFGSLFPVLHRMEESGWVEAEWPRVQCDSVESSRSSLSSSACVVPLTVASSIWLSNSRQRTCAVCGSCWGLGFSHRRDPWRGGLSACTSWRRCF